jgi:EAL domain-containing protein (putative c-di-GMP-specific phosphodiesterase class I)
MREDLEMARAAAPGARRLVADVEDQSVAPDDVKAALRYDRFTLYCQPVLDLKNGRTAQHELLLRMVGAGGELILPQAFLAAARRGSLLSAIDQWVVRHAIRVIDEQVGVGRSVRLEVNLSSEAPRDGALIPAIESELMASGIDPARLVLALPEQVAVADLEGARALATRARAMGCSFALDDFGSSFGSFRFLKELPVDWLKLDGELIVTLSESRTAQLVVKALADVARGAGAETVAVYVSDDDTLRLLGDLGVSHAQGHTVGRPCPLAEALSAMESEGLRPVETAASAQPAAATRNLAK